jgi:hypothetical protein
MEQEVFDEAVVEDKDEDTAASFLLAAGATESGPLSALQKVYHLSQRILISKLRLTATKICSSPQRRKRFRATAEKIHKDELAPSGRKVCTLMAIRDVKHRWNFTDAMIKRALLLRKVCDNLSDFVRGVNRDAGNRQMGQKFSRALPLAARGR